MIIAGIVTYFIIGQAVLYFSMRHSHHYLNRKYPTVATPWNPRKTYREPATIMVVLLCWFVWPIILADLKYNFMGIK